MYNLGLVAFYNI